MLLDGVFVLPKIAPAAGQNLTVHWEGLQEDVGQDLSLRQSERLRRET